MSKQSKTKQKNEKIKRKYLNWMTNAQGFSPKSITTIEKALWKYEEFTDDSDYASFSVKQAEGFKRFLANSINKRSKKSLGSTSQYHHLRHVKNFFIWLSGQAGYKSRVSPSDVMYLQLSKKDRRLATATKAQKYPTLQQIQALCGFEIKNEIDMRDRALIAFTALTGMRDRAVVTLPLGCFDPDKLVVDQNPNRGVETKFSKTISTTLFAVDKSLIKYVTDWYQFLINEKKFGIDDPLFPATEIGHISANHHAFESKGMSKSFWADAGPMRKIFQARSQETGITYFSPHKFRHFIINEAQKHISSVEQLKAVSQNLGHEHLATTFYSYGNMPDQTVNKLVSNIDFSSSSAIKAQDEETSRMMSMFADFLKQRGKNEL